MDRSFLTLDDESCDRDTVGGKAAVLAELRAAGFPVPAGLVVTRDAVDASGDALDATALTQALDRLGWGPFAVRSSAFAEDLPDASYAGLYESYLGVARADVPDAVRRCFASAQTHRVERYREHLADSIGSGRMAVLIQPMVQADAAGVAFTANPLTGAGEIVVTAVAGLAEGLVGGEQRGEEWIVSGGAPRPTRRGDVSVLRRDQALAVAEVAARIARRYGQPQDVEWAVADEQVFVLQARPMTALPERVEWAPPGRGFWVRNFRLGEWLPEAVTPLFADWFVPLIEDGYLKELSGWGGRALAFPYAMVHGWYYNSLPATSPRAVADVLVRGRGRIVRLLVNGVYRTQRNPVKAHRQLLGAAYGRWKDFQLPAYQSLVAEGRRDVAAADPARLVEIVNHIGDAAGRYLWSIAIIGGSAWKMEAGLTQWCRTHLADTLRRDLGGNVQVLLQGLGAQSVVPLHAAHSLDWYHPTLGELAGGFAVAATPARQGALADRREAAAAACRRALERRPRRLAEFEDRLSMAQQYARYREEQCRDLTLAWPLLRQCLRRLGETLAAAGRISSADDVFFLERTELDSQAVVAEVAAERRRTWQKQRRLAAPLTLGQPPRFPGDVIGRMAERARGARTAPAGAIVGHPASAGQATGRVRLVWGPDDFASFEEGEILVARATAPAWTPLFARASAVVTDSGTLAAHASLIAREYGIPAVVSTGDATRRLRTGDIVTVDGTSGLVVSAGADGL